MYELVQQLQKEGWIKEEFYIYKIKHNFEIDIEFCIGDFCVGLYNSETKDLLIEQKIRCKSFEEAIIHAKILELTYGLDI